MTLKPCIACGTPSEQSRCPDHRKDARVRNTPGQAAYDPTWRRLSLRARKDMPFCQDCGTTDNLTADHLLPKQNYPELVHAIENITTRCRSCNSRRGATGFTQAEAHEVLTRLQRAYNRRPTRKGRQRINAAHRAVDQGGRGQRAAAHPVGKARGGMNLTGVKS